MRYWPTLLALPIALLVLLVGSRYGADCTGEETKSSDASAMQPKPQSAPGPEPQRTEGELFQFAGAVDATNRFPSTVIVVPEFPLATRKSQRCSGVLMDPGLVLTTGHCVCRKQPFQEPGQQERVLIDGTSCAATAIIETVIYDEPTPGKGLSSQRQEFQGRVMPHPGFKVLLDKEGAVVSSSADLAVVFLDTPVTEVLPLGNLAESDVEANESIIIVGYGSDERLGSLGGARRFNETRVAASPRLEGGRVLFEQPRRDIYKGESGGPCLRESPQGLTLIGISSRNLGKEPTFISTYPYHSWLLEQRRQAAPRDSGQ